MQPDLRPARLLAFGLLLAVTGCGKKPSAQSDASSNRRQSAPVRPAAPPEPEVLRTLGGIELGPLVEPGPASESIVESALALTDNREKGVRGLIAAGPAAKKVVLALLASKSFDELTGALEVLEAEGDPTESRPGAVEPLLALMTHEVNFVRDRAWELAPKVVEGEDLLRLVKRVEPEQRATVIRLLELWDSTEIRAELALLAQSPDAELSREAAYALTTHARPISPEAVGMVTELLTSPARRALGLTTARRLAGTLPPELTPVVSRTIDESLLSEDIELVLAATRATALLSIEDRLPLLEQLGRDGREDVRRVAAEALGSTSASTATNTTRRAIEVLDRLLADPEGTVRIAAIRARGEISQAPELAADAARALAQKLQDGHRGVRLAAAVVLAQPAFAAESKALLVSQLGREDNSGQAVILEAMATSKSRALVEAVIEKLDGGPLVPIAHQALSTVAGKDFPASAADWRPWLDETFPTPVEAPKAP